MFRVVRRKRLLELESASEYARTPARLALYGKRVGDDFDLSYLRDGGTLDT
jgi:hypothetical protein